MKIDEELYELIIGEFSFELEENEDRFYCEMEFDDVNSMVFNISEFADNLTIRIHSSNGFETYFFYELELSKKDNEVVFTYVFQQPNKYWEGKYGLSTMLSQLSEIVNNSSNFWVVPDSLELEDDWKSISLSTKIDIDFSLFETIKKHSASLNDLIRRAELFLSGALWRKEYETDEKLFCTEIIFPLLRKIGFIDVRYNHGAREFGKDFTFSEITKFGSLRHYAIQVKAGNLRGNVNSEIDEIIGQLNDTFTMPYYEVIANETRNISTFIVLISGHFTENAKEKIINKIPPSLKGCIYFIDKDKFIELLETYWR
ncbi:hypothetical protein EZS27_028485 [termite gut metagenome]|uniref:Restriction endonuclease type IV Mrr domain-containing protein n=1 Tax=termite gut metagenome TaxID=433724 RepID=A0A5J4QIZ6_9ZZZZ